MIAWILLVIGAIAGAIVGEWGGALLGAAVGYLAGDRFAVMRRFSELESSVADMKQRLRSLREAIDIEPAAKRAAPSAARPAETRAEVAPGDRERTKPEAPAESPPAARPTPPPRAPEAPKARPIFPTDFQRATSRAAMQEMPLVRWVRTWFTTGNMVAKIGALILFIGAAFLVKYVAEHTRVPIELRLSGVCVGAIVLLVFGWRLRQRQPGYALILQGVSIAILYLVVFAALRQYALIAAGPAFGLLAALGVFSAILAIAQNSLLLAMMGAAGGFLAPILTSTGQGSHVVLFSYYALLDAGILAMAWFKSWRPLNLLGFVFTFGIGTTWGVLRYVPEQLGTTEPFLVLFFVFFVAIAVIFAFRQAPRFSHYVDGTLVFGTPVIAFALQSGLVRHLPYALSYSALAVAAFYIFLAWFLHTRRRPNLRLLVEAFLALGVAFATLAVPLALDGRWTAATWALEGAAILWVGIRQQRLLPRISGVLLQFGGGIAYAASSVRAPDLVPVLNAHFVGSMLVSGAGLLSAWLLWKAEDRVRREEGLLVPLLFFWGLAWWLFAGVAEIHHAAPDQYFDAGLLVFLSVSALGLGHLATRLEWNLPRYPALCLLPLMIGIAWAWFIQDEHFFSDGGFIAWPLAIAAFYFLVRRHEERLAARARILLHIFSLWLLAFLVSGETGWVVERQLPSESVWPFVPWLIVPSVFLILLPGLTSSGRWPFAIHAPAYMGPAALGLQAYLVVASLVANLASTGDPAPLPYVPIVNPLDLAQGFVIVAIASVVLRQRAIGVPAWDATQWRLPFAVLTAMVFVWLNATVLRTLHHWGGVPFDFDDMARSTLVQSTLSIFWTIVALGTMLWGTRRAQRSWWLAGAVLMGVVVVKLMFVDLSSVGTVARIVSFVAVGLLMLLLGNFLRMPAGASAPSMVRP